MTPKTFLVRNWHLAEATLRHSHTPFMMVPRRSLASQDYANRYGAQWHPVYPRTKIQRTPPIQYGQRVADFRARVVDNLPDLGVLVLRDAYLVGLNALLVSKEGYLLPEPSFYGTRWERIEIPIHPFRVVKLKGVCLSLASDWASTNYSHSVLDQIGRFALYEKAGFALNDVNHVLCAVLNEHTRQILRRLGIPFEKLVVPQPGVAVKADVIYEPSYPGDALNYPGWLVEFFREHFVQNPVRQFRRLYVPRTGTRRVLNEKALLQALAPLDFSIFDPAEHEDAPKYFQEAEIVSGPHGAGLSNLVFCQPGTRVLELFPGDHISPSF